MQRPTAQSLDAVRNAESTNGEVQWRPLEQLVVRTVSRCVRALPNSAGGSAGKREGNAGKWKVESGGSWTGPQGLSSDVGKVDWEKVGGFCPGSRNRSKGRTIVILIIILSFFLSNYVSYAGGHCCPLIVQAQVRTNMAGLDRLVLGAKKNQKLSYLTWLGAFLRSTHLHEADCSQITRCAH